ncbi:hypothetical protein COOONC_25223 [Cooperia oncophora]
MSISVQFEKPAPPSAFARHVQELKAAVTSKTGAGPSEGATTTKDPCKMEYREVRIRTSALAREYSNPAAQRPRPTTPTQSCTLERFAFNAPFEGMFSSS